jgi:hypothetical protein
MYIFVFIKIIIMKNLIAITHVVLFLIWFLILMIGFIDTNSLDPMISIIALVALISQITLAIFDEINS